nr:uncharacterized protein LOC128700084 [Cherax quadricarinatus]
MPLTETMQDGHGDKDGGSGEFWDVDLEAGRSSSGEDADGGRSVEDEAGEGTTAKRETVVLRLGEGKLSGPMRFITCYASVFTFVVMIAFIVWLLIISPPFTVEPEMLPGRGDSNPAPPDITRTTLIPTNTETPEFSADFNQA